MLSLTYVLANGQMTTLAVSETASASAQTALIQGALDAVAQGGGGTVSLSAGTWLLQGSGKAADGCLRIGSNTTLEGVGSGATVLQLADGSSAVTGLIRTDSGRTRPDGTYTTIDNVTVRNLTIDGNSANTTGEVDGFYTGPRPGTAQADTDITLDGIEVMNCSRYGIDPHERTVGLTIRNASAHHNGLDGIVIDFCSNVLIENSTSFANGRHGFNIVTGSTAVTMRGNDATDNGGAGIVVQTGDNEIRAWTAAIDISGGDVSGNARAGIEVRQVSGVSIDGVAVADNAMDGIMLSGVHGATVSSNTFTGNGGTGAVRVAGYLQDFGDTDVGNDRWIGSRDVVIDGIAQADTEQPAGTVGWAYVLSEGNDSVTGSNSADTIAAGSGDDSLAGSGGNDMLYGNDGADTLDGGSGSDRLIGGAGSDRLRAGVGFDTLDGGSARDTADFAGATAAVQVDMTTVALEARMGAIAIADFVSIENVDGSAHGDTLKGNSSANRIDGRGGADTVDAGAGDDTVLGNTGNDRLIGNLGNDTLTGGSGNDVFAFATASGRDAITDFIAGQDRIEIAGTSFATLTLTQVGSDALVRAGTSEITLVGVQAANLTASDFSFA